ncbi:Contactin-associated protein-like 2 [Exaiptasia diaphana]|nr:Contactin-associated protein-like 2 [Exaiptasia diaphana]
MTDKGGVGVTVVSHDSEARTLVDGYESPGSYSKDVRYNGASMAQLAKLTQISTNCEQLTKFECKNDVAFLSESYGYNGGCNCGSSGTGWRSDSGVLTDKTTLPVSQLRFGDTGDSNEQAYHTLGFDACAA